MNKKESAHRWFINTALAYLGKPYIWGGDDPSGFDCSGYVVECLKTAGLLPEKADLTADLLLLRYNESQCKLPSSGCLLFWLNEESKAFHVGICLDEYFQISSSGGTSATTDARKAWSQNAFVRIRPIRYHSSRHVIADPFL